MLAGFDGAIVMVGFGSIGTAASAGTPTAQAQHAFLLPHNESISIADYFTLRQNGNVVYRPTCHYAYHPCDDAVLSLQLRYHCDAQVNQISRSPSRH